MPAHSTERIAGKEERKKNVIQHPFQFELIIQTRQITQWHGTTIIIARPSFDSMHIRTDDLSFFLLVHEVVIRSPDDEQNDTAVRPNRVYEEGWNRCIFTVSDLTGRTPHQPPYSHATRTGREKWVCVLGAVCVWAPLRLNQCYRRCTGRHSTRTRFTRSRFNNPYSCVDNKIIMNIKWEIKWKR